MEVSTPYSFISTFNFDAAAIDMGFFRYYKELEDCGLIKPMTCEVENDKNRPDGTSHYITPSGMSSLVKHYLSTSGLYRHTLHSSLFSSIVK